MKNDSRNEILPFITGLIFICIGIFWNEWTVSALFSPDRAIGSSSKRLIIWAFDIICIASGGVLIIKRKKESVISIAKKLLLLLGTLCTLIIVSELLFPSFLPFLPLNLQGYIDPSFRILCQNSKIEKIPHNYIAIMGDSYAHGYGDWLIETNPWTNGKFHSAHILHDVLKRDVISFGFSGASTIGSLMRKPEQDLRILRYRFSVEDPMIILAYFYEGNDLRDNLEELSQLNYPGIKSTNRSLNKRELNSFISTYILNRKNDNVFQGYTVSLKFIVNLFNNAISRMLGSNEYQRTPENISWNPSVYNKALINGKYKYLPDRLQGPVLDMSEDEIHSSIEVVDVCLRLLCERFPGTQIALVYVPSVLSCYTLDGKVSVQAPEGYPEIYSAESVYERSNAVATSICKVCKDNGVTFIDTRKDLRTASLKNLIHGPKDWKHFNKHGYEIFTNSIISSLSQVRGEARPER